MARTMPSATIGASATCVSGASAFAKMANPVRPAMQTNA